MTMCGATAEWWAEGSGREALNNPLFEGGVNVVVDEDRYWFIISVVFFPGQPCPESGLNDANGVDG